MQETAGKQPRRLTEEYKEAREEARDQLVARLELCDSLEEDRYYPDIDPEDFCTPEEIAANPNPYFMLIPNRVMVYGGETDEGEEEIVEVTVTGGNGRNHGGHLH